MLILYRFIRYDVFVLCVVYLLYKLALNYNIISQFFRGCRIKWDGTVFVSGLSHLVLEVKWRKLNRKKENDKDLFDTFI